MDLGGEAKMLSNATAQVIAANTCVFPVSTVQWQDRYEDWMCEAGGNKETRDLQFRGESVKWMATKNIRGSNVKCPS